MPFNIESTHFLDPVPEIFEPTCIYHIQNGLLPLQEIFPIENHKHYSSVLRRKDGKNPSSYNCHIQYRPI